MRLVLLALRRPVTIIVAVLAIAAFAALAVRRMPADIFPRLGSPTVYVAQPYGGMDPAQMEGFLTYYFEYHFLYITGIEHVESKSIQGAALMKLVFHPGTDMSQAMAEVVCYVNRARAFMPPGTVPPFITRFDAGSVAIGQLVFSSPTRPPGEMQDIALNRVRPLFATLEGVSAPPPFGGNQKSIVIRLRPEALRSYRISPEEAIAAVNKATAVVPSGNVRIGDLMRIATTNAVLGADVDKLLDAPVRPGAANTVYLRDIATIEVGTDIVTGYAHVNGKRTVYIPITKRADASSLRVMERVRAALPEMRKAAPEDVAVTVEFDQTGFVAAAIRNLTREGIAGALLTALMVLLFLRDWRGAVVVVLTIPFALLAAVVWLWTLGQTINIMTLGGLALAVGVLVDEATVEIENIHSRLAAGTSQAASVVEACRRTATPRLLAMLVTLSVFAPAFLMSGIARQLFVPLALAIGAAMVSSYVLSSTLVPVLAVRWLRHGRGGEAGRLVSFYRRYLEFVLRWRWPLAGAYAAAAALLLVWLAPLPGREVFPPAGDDIVQLRLRLPAGTRIERTELAALKALEVIQNAAGRENVLISTDFVGVQPASYPVNTIHLWTSGPQEAVIKVALQPGAPLRGEALRERLRADFRRELPQSAVSFEAGDIVGQVLSFGSATPIEVAVQGANLAANRAFAEKLRGELAKLPVLRDLAFAQPLDYPSLEVTIDRVRAGQYGLTMSGVARSLVAATSSSRFTDPNYWRDPASGNAFQIQVEVPQQRMAAIDDVRELPVMANGQARPLLGDVADVKTGTAAGAVERYNMQRVVSLTANLSGAPLSDAGEEVRKAIARAGEPPRGVAVKLRGQIPPLEETTKDLESGLLLALGAVFVLLAAYFQSLRIAAAVLATAPAVLIGVLAALLLTGTTLNVQSFLGAIMAVGISVANAILLMSFAETARKAGAEAAEAARDAAAGRLRAILMTASAMVAGMVPLALGTGEGGSQTAPLGRAVIGGLVAATFATLTVLPAVYAILMRGAARHSASLDPADPESRFYEGA